MNIIQIIPGSGGSFYCGNCMRDSKYFLAMRKLGHNVIKVPMYLPLFSDEHDLGDVPIFYGAISTYLKQYRLFRNMPKWIEKLLNSRPMMKMAASMAGSTRAEGLEDMTISMLLGEKGAQKQELDIMVNWIVEHAKPDIIHISNALLLGLAKTLKERTGVPVVCSLQDEDVWVEASKPEFRRKIWDLMHERSADVDAFISVSDFFGGVMKDKMNLPENKVHRIYLGVDPDDYNANAVKSKPVNIGYISRMCHENGFHVVVDAFIELKKKPGFEKVKLIVTGGSTGDDTAYIREQKRKIRLHNLSASFEILPDFEGESRDHFFGQVRFISVPVLIGEAFGMYLLESMASGVPVVQPALGAFPEIVEISGGGKIYPSNDPVSLCNAWVQLLENEDYIEQLSVAAVEGVKEKFNIHAHAKEMVELYESLLKTKNN